MTFQPQFAEVNEIITHVVLVGLAGALLMFAGDMLLYYTPEDFSYDSKSSSAEKVQAIVDVMKALPAKRVMAGGMIGPVSAFLQCMGFCHIVLITDESMETLAMVAFLFSCFGIIVSGGWTNWISVIYYLAVFISILA